MKAWRRFGFAVTALAAALIGCATTGDSTSVYIGAGYYDSWGYAGPWYGADPTPPIGPPPPRPAHPIAPAPRPPVRPMPVRR